MAACVFRIAESALDFILVSLCSVQTGGRLKGLVAGVVEASLQLVADLKAAAHRIGSPADEDLAGGAAAAAGDATPGSGQAVSVPSQHTSGGKADGGGTGSSVGIAEALAAAHFVEVYSSRAGGATQGPSGIRMH